jgi:hypothetical protein
MGAHNSSLNVSEMAMSSKIKQSNEVDSNITCNNSLNNLMSVHQSNCGSATQTISGANQTSDASCKAEQNMTTINDQKAKQDLQQSLTQAATSTMKGINIGTSNSAENRSRTSISGEVELDNISAQNCNATNYELNAIYLTQDSIAGNCNIVANDITQSAKAAASVTCGLKSDNHQASEQTMSQTVSQVASATMIGIDPMIAVYMYLIYAVTSIAGSAIAIYAFKNLIGKILLAIIIIVIVGNFVYIYDGPGFIYSIKPMEQIKVPFYLDGDYYYEEMEMKDDNSSSDSKNLFIVKYSKVFAWDPSKDGPFNSGDEGVRDKMKTKGLMNEKYKTIDGYNSYGEDNVGTEDNSFSAPDSGKSIYGGQWPQPEDAREFMYSPVNEKKYYAFEIIKYGIKDDGSILTLDVPITLFYTKLNEIFWNYDKLGEIDCITNDKMCGIDNSKFQRGAGVTSEIGGKTCNKDGDCDGGYFCGTGAVGCIKCEYCKSKLDGYGGLFMESGSGCLERCDGVGETPRISLKEKLDDCKACLGKILQQSETVVSGEISSGSVSSNSHSNIYPNYEDYVHTEFINEISVDEYDAEDVQENYVYGTIRLITGGDGHKKLKRYEGKNNVGAQRWVDIDVGFAEDNFDNLSTLKDIITWDPSDNFIKINGGAAGAAGIPDVEEKCILTPIEYNEKESPVQGECNLDYNKPKPLNKNNQHNLTVDGGADGGWSSVPDSTGSCNNNDTNTCHNIGDIKCIDQYEATCGKLSAKVSKASEGGFTPCDEGKKLDTLKTLVGNVDCGSAAYNESTSGITGLWEDTCKAVCCIDSPADTPPALTTIYNQGNQVYCKHVPSGSIGEFKRILPHEANVVGIRMYRDGSEMGSKQSPATTIKYMKLFTYFIIFIIILMCFNELYSNSENNSGSDAGGKDEAK